MIDPQCIERPMLGTSRAGDRMAAVEDKLRALVYGQNLALDGEGLWRADDTFAGRVWEGLLAEPDPIQFFRMLGARERTDALAALSDWAEISPYPVVKAAGRLLTLALRRLIEDGTPLEKTLGLAPDQGQTARHAVKLARRDGLLRKVAGLRCYSGLTARQAARSIRDDFTRYLTDHDATREGRPQNERDGLFWVLAQMEKADDRPHGLTTIMPLDVGHLARIIVSEG